MVTCAGPHCQEPVKEGMYCPRHQAQLDAFNAWQEEMADA